MRRFTLTHNINCSAPRFWEVFFDRDFNTALFLDELRFPVYDIIEQTNDDGIIKRHIRATPKMNMPKAVMKVLGDSFSYEEHGIFDPTTEIWTFEMIPSTLAAKLRNAGTVRCEAIDDTHCRRIATMESEAKIFGIGGLIESSGLKELRIGWNQSAEFLNRWLADHPA